MIGQKAALMTANMVVGTLLGLVAVIFVGRFFEPEHVGQVSGALGILGLLYFVTDLGMGSAHVKRVSEGRDPGDCFATFATFKLVSTIVFVGLVAAGVWIYLGVLDKPLIDTTLPIILVALAYYVARSLAEVGQSSFDARLEAAKSQAARLIDTLLRVGLTIFFALAMARLVDGVEWAKLPAPAWVARDPGLALALATLAGAAAAAIVSLTLLFRTLEWGRFRWELLKDYASFALPLFLSNAIGLISLYVDSSMLIVFRSAAEAGILEQVRRLPLVLAGFGTALSALLFPAVSAMVARNDREGIQRTTDGSLRYLSMLLIPTVAFTAAFPYDVIRLTIGEKYLAGGPALAILCGYVLLVTFGHVHSFLLLGHDRSDLVAKVGIASASTVILLNLVLVPDDIQSLGIPLVGLGVTGAALATLASGFVWYAGMRIASRRITGYRERNHMPRHVVAASVMALALLALDATLLPLLRWYHFALYFALGVLLYAIALFVLRELSRKDLDFAREALHPRDMARYVRDEIMGRG